MKTTSRKLRRIALVVPAVAVLAACGAHANDDAAPRASVAQSDTGSAPVAAPAERAPDGLGSGAGASDSLGSSNLSLTTSDLASKGTGGGTTATPATDTSVEGRSVISKGQISLQAAKIDDARFELVKILDSYDGVISAENSSGDDKGRTERDRLELRVPSKNFSDAMDAIARLKLGTLLERSSTSTDVTTKVIDTNTRVRTQKLSLARVQALLDRASSIDEIIRIEGQVARRQADLDSLEQQQKYLADQTSLSTITVYLTVPDKTPATKHHKKTHHTFLTGLDAGWGSLKSLTTNVLTGVGAVLPYGAVVAALVVIVKLGRRRRVSAR